LQKPIRIGALLVILSSPAPGAQTSGAVPASDLAAKPLVVVEGVAADHLRRPMAVTYPPEAVAAKISGTVVTQILIAEDGSVAGQRIVSGPELLRPGAESAVNNAEYRPMVLNGKPVMMATTIRLVFKIDNSTDPPTLKVREDLSSDGQAVDAATLESDATFAHPFEKQISSADASKTNGVGYNVKPAHLLVQYAPAYPPDAKRLNIEGSVKLHAVIQKDGSTGGVTYISGPYPLAAAAIEAVKLWKYSPMMLLGKPVDVDTTITVIFTLGH
jgi:TonB family protein